jgi:phenylacetate-CoA ligase
MARVRALIFWLARKLLRRFSRFSDVESAIKDRGDFESKSREEIKAYQLARFNELWAFACKTVLYYRDLQKCKALPVSFTSLEEISHRVPVLEKVVVQANPDQFLSVKHDIGFWTLTGGSTGTPMRCYWGKYAHIENQRDIYHYQSLWDIDVWDKTAFLWGHTHLFPKGLKGKIKLVRSKIEDKIRNRIRLSAYRIGEKDLQNYHAIMRKKGVRFLYAYSNALYLFAKANENSPKLNNLKLAVSSAGPLSALQKKEIEKVLKCPVANEYGAVEIGLIASSHNLTDLKVCERSVIVEAIPTTQGMYEIIVTNLRNNSFPLIRYRIGDLTDGPLLPSEQGSAVIGRIIGRIYGVIVCPSGRRIHGHAFTQIIEHFPEIVQYQLFQRSTQVVTLRVVGKLSLSQKTHAGIQKGFRELLGNNMTLNIKEVAKIETSLAGKHRLVISELDRKHSK